MNVDAPPRQDLALTVQGQEVRVFANYDVGNESLSRQATLNKPRGRLGLDNPIGALAAGIFGTDCDDDTVLSRDDIDAFAAIFANLVHLATPTRTLDAVWLNHFLDMWQVFGQVLAFTLTRLTRFFLFVAVRVVCVLLLFQLSDRDEEVLKGQLTLVLGWGMRTCTVLEWAGRSLQRNM